MSTSTSPRWLRRRYYAFRITNASGFYVPVAVLYLLDKGFGLGFVGVAYAVWAFAKVAAEIPSGYLGDWLGRRGSLAIGAGLRVATLVGYAVADSRLAFLALHLVWAAGWAFRSGTVDAWLYELLAARSDADQFARIEGRGSTALLGASAAGALVGGVLYQVEPAYPFLANAALAGLGIPLLYTIPAVDADRAGTGTTGTATGTTGTATEATGTASPRGGDVFAVRDAVAMLRVQLGRPGVRWLVLYAALFSSLFSVTRIYEQPALDAVGVPAAGLGVVYAGFKVVSAAAASTAGYLEERLGARLVFALLVPVYGLSYASVAFLPAFVVPVLFLNRGLRVVTRPVRNQYLNDRLADVGRATVLSGVSMAISLVSGVARLVAGWGTEAVGVVEFLPWAGVVVAVGAGLLWFAVSPVRSVEATPADQAGVPTPTD